MKGTKGEVKVGGEGQVGTRGKGGWAWATWKWLSQVPSGLSARPARNIHADYQVVLSTLRRPTLAAIEHGESIKSLIEGVPQQLKWMPSIWIL